MSEKYEVALVSSGRCQGQGRRSSWPTSSRQQSASPHQGGDGSGQDRRHGHHTRSVSLSAATLESRHSSSSCDTATVSVVDEADGIAVCGNTLKKRLKQLSLNKKAVGGNAKDVNELCGLLLERLKQLYPSSFRWEMMRSGSYYEKVKIDVPDEYDCMFTCDIRAEAVYTETPSPCFCALLKSKAVSAEIFCTTDGQDYVCPKKIRCLFRDNIKKIVEDPLLSKFKISVKRDNHRCPAVTLTVQNVMETDGHFDIDIVPAIRLVEWPKTARDETLRRIGISDIQDIDRKCFPCVVPKIHEDECSADAIICRLWRLSFSAVEKKLILHADGTRKTCCKDVLRLLKADLAAHCRPENQVIRSYHIKTIFLHILDEKDSDSDWSEERLRECYSFALRKVIDCLEQRSIPHYFVGANLIPEDTDTKKLSSLANYFKRLLK